MYPRPRSGIDSVIGGAPGDSPRQAHDPNAVINVWETRMKKPLDEVFSEALGIDRSLVSDTLAYNEIQEWDSIAHMSLVAALEENYGIMMESDDVIGMSSVAKAREILSKYGVES